MQSGGAKATRKKKNWHDGGKRGEGCKLRTVRRSHLRKSERMKREVLRRRGKSETISESKTDGRQYQQRRDEVQIGRKQMKGFVGGCTAREKGVAGKTGGVVVKRFRKEIF